MARPRKIPDSAVHDAVLSLLRQGGEKAVTFSAVAAGCGLAASSLAERFGSVPAMIAAAHADAWGRLETLTEAAIVQAPRNARGATALLKALSTGPVPLPATAPERALAWRAQVEAALALRLGQGQAGREAAAILFAVWQDRHVWGGLADRPVRLKAALKRIGL